MKSMKPSRFLLGVVVALAACGAPRPPKLAAPLAYGPVAEAPDEAFRAKPPPPGPADTSPLFQAAASQLPNGMRVIVAPRIGLPVVSVRLVLARGSRDLPGKRMELLDMFGDALLRAHDADDAGFGADFGADGCSLYIRTLSRSLDWAVGRIGAMAVSPKLGEKEVEWLRNEQVDRWDSGSGPGNNLRSLLFERTDPYAPIDEEGQKAILATSLRDLAELHAQLFHPEHATLVVAGDVTMAEVDAAAKKHFGAWKGSRAPLGRATAPATPAGSGGRAALVNYRGILVHAQVVARAPALGEADAEAMMLLAEVLSQRKGRLHDEVRAGLGATYSFGGGVSFGRAASWLSVGGALELEKALPAMMAVVKAIRSARDQGIEESELTGARARFMTAQREGAGSAAGLSGMLADAVVLGVPFEELLARRERLAKLTAADLQRAARTWLSEERLRLVVLGPEKYIETGFEGLGIGPIEWRDWKGKVLK